MAGIEVKQANAVFTGGDQVSIQSPSLLNGLVRNQSQALKVLQISHPSLALDDIHVGSDGAVKIVNKGFYDSLKATMANIPATNAMLDNGACGAGC